MAFLELKDIHKSFDGVHALKGVDFSVEAGEVHGLIGENGRGTPEHFGVADRVDILTGTLGKALGGASGGYMGHGAKLVPVQIVLVGSRSARFIVLISGLRTFSTPWPGRLPR